MAIPPTTLATIGVINGPQGTIWSFEVVGHKLETHHPVIEPLSDIRVGNGIIRCRDGGSRSAFLSCRDRRGDKDELEKARCSRDKCAYHPRSSIPEDWVVVCAVVFEPVSAAIPHWKPRQSAVFRFL